MVATSGTENGKHWRLANSLVEFVRQCDERWPRRDTSSDGSIGDARHQAEVSDHNPNRHGVVTAVDITAWLHDGHNIAQLIANSIQHHKPHRIKYVIWNHRIMDGVREPDGEGGNKPWQWRPYTGSSPHTDHIHISVSSEPDLYDRAAGWQLRCFGYLG